MKVMTILGTRPEIIRLSAVMQRLDAARQVEHILVHTGQNYDAALSEIFFSDLGVRQPDHFLNVSRESLGQTCGDILAKSEAVMKSETPDAVLILGDTNSALAAIIAKRMHIPVFHMEAGNRSFDHNVPEEVNRRIVDHTADFNLVYTEHARRNLLAEGLEPRRIHLTGSPMREVLNQQRTRIEASTATTDLGLEPGGFFVVSAHREENVDHPQRLAALMASLELIGSTFDKQVVVSLHPRTRNRLGDIAIGHRDSPVQFHPPFGFSDYNRLQLDAACVVSDSGTITEEASILGFRAVTIRDSMERPEGLDAGAIIMCGLEPADVVGAIETMLETEASRPRGGPPAGYEIEDTSERVLRLIFSLTGRARTWSNLH